MSLIVFLMLCKDITIPVQIFVHAKLNYVNHSFFFIFTFFNTTLSGNFDNNMLSILIPTYNFNCFSLANELEKQITALDITAEVIVMDDATPDTSISEALNAINSLPHCRLVRLGKNVGIARIRNLLAREAQFPYFLFLDSDVFPVSNLFVKQYLDARNAADVVCGGLLFRDNLPSPHCSLRYKYGSCVESQSVEKRMRSPYGEFRTLNFFISRKAFEATQFNEDFLQYGHEDTLFGKELDLNGFSITHIDNPIYHDVPDTNEQFLSKTRRSIDNLKKHQEILLSHVKLLRFYNKLHRYHLDVLVATIFSAIRSLLTHNLLSKNPSLFLFNIYKVGYLCHIMNSKD